MTTADDVRAAAGFPPRNPALTVACPVPHCHAPVRQPCRGPSGRALKQPHPSRTEAAVSARPRPM